MKRTIQFVQSVALTLPSAIVLLTILGCSEQPMTLAEYEKQTTKILNFDLQSVTPGELPIVQTVDGYTLTIDGLIAKQRKLEGEETENTYAFGLGNPGFTATLNLVDQSGKPANFSVESINVSNNNQFKPGAKELPRCPVFATGIRNQKKIYQDYRIGPSFGNAGQFNTFRFRQTGIIDTLILKAEPTGKEYYPNFDDFVLRVGYVARH